MVAYDSLHLFIDGAWLAADGRMTHQVLSPATGLPLGPLPLATTHDLDRAVAAAARAFDGWKKTPAYDRARILRRAADLVRERTEHIAGLLTQEEGKTLPEARREVGFAADVLEWFAEEGRRAYGRVVPPRAAGARQLVLREPVGPVAAFSPWNFPAGAPTLKIAAALAAGCTCVLKPAEETPATALAITRALADAGLPAGVLNVVFGVPAEVSRHLIAAPEIRKISFTGSVAVGKQLARLAAEGMKRVTMELGGHAPVVVFDDVDAEQVASASATMKYRNAGQICVSPTRFYVHKKLHDKFVAKFAAVARDTKVGDGLDAASAMGPVANARRLDAMGGFIADAAEHRAEIVTGGARIGNQGYFWQPTVLAHAPENARIMNEEPFGPVASIVPFEDFNDVVAHANRLPYGLAAYAFTNSAQRASAISDALQSGMVGINNFGVSMPETPFGGVKDSGYGSEGGLEGLDAYLSTKFVHQS